MEPSPEPQELLSLSDVATMLSVTTMTLRRWITAGRLPAYRIGKLYKVRRSDLMAFVEASKVSGRSFTSDTP